MNALPSARELFPAPGLSPAQERMWFLDRLSPGDGANNMVVCERLTGPLDTGALERALSEIVARHEALRTVFPDREGVPEARVLDPEPVVVEHLTPVGEPSPETLAELSNRPFDLASGPLLRAALARVGPEEHILHLVVHHIAGDAWSIEQILYPELAALYSAFASGRPSPLAPPRRGYSDHVRERRERPADVTSPARELDGVPALELPTDRPRPAVRTTEGDLVIHRVPIGLWRRVTELARTERCTPFMVLLAAYQVLLSRYSGQEDFCVGTPVAGRDREEDEEVFGLFVNTLALRADLGGDPAFRDLLKRVRRRAFTMYGHAAVPFERLVAELRLGGDPARTPLVQTLLTLGNPEAGSLELDGLRVEPVLSGLVSAKFDLSLNVVVYPEHLQLMFDYSTALYDRASVERMAVHLETLLGSVTATPGGRLSELEILPEAERAALLGEPPEELAWEEGALLLDHLVARQAARTPEAPAVVTAEATLTYGDLDRAADAVAAGLRPLLDSGPVEPRVGLALTASPEAIVALLGVLKAGAAYVPLDPAQPVERLTALLRDAGVAAVIADEAGFAGFTGLTGGPVVTRADLAAWTSRVAPAREPAKEPTREPVRGRPVPRHPDQAAYVIYTSGSTGSPKGVVVGHRTLSHLARSFRDLHGFGPGERVLVVPPLSFDASAGDVFPALISGAALVLHPDPASLTGPGLAELCDDLSVTMVDTACALWQQWVEELDRAGLRLRGPLTTMMVGGESVPVARLRTWAGLTGGRVAFHNHYGPTEATVCATSYRTTDGAEVNAPHLPIGTALAHTRVYVLDRHGNPAPTGVPGEVHIGGECLAHGYLGRPGLTAERFLPDPFSPRAGARMYATGDLARWLPGGDLEFLGRTDRQVKVNGVRIEPGEVEAACLAHPGVREAVVVAREGRLVAYLVGEPVGLARLRAFLASRLPGSMLPGVVVMLPALPLTPHGKIDHRALPEPDTRSAPPYEAPREGTERELAAIWAGLLGGEPGRGDNFFDLGGTSLLVPRVVSGISARLGATVPMSEVFTASDLADLAGIVDGGPAETVDLRAEAVLPPDVVPGGPVVTGPPRRVLLTGATGFLGAHLLAELLRRTEATVHCLVRGSEPEERLRAGLERYGLWEEDLAGRIVAEPGDLGVPGLGLPGGRFAELAGTADLIVHNGAVVNFAWPYRRLRAANVDGLVEVLRLATSGGRTVPVHLVSTLGVHLTPGERTVREKDPLPDPEPLTLGYDRSKWVADRIAGLARHAGLPVSVHRPARISADSGTGTAAPDDFLGRFFETCARLGSVPEGERLDMAPVDHVAAAIVHLALSGAVGDFHHHNPGLLRPAVLAEGLAERGFPVRLMPSEEWRRLARDRVAVGDDLPIALYPAFIAEYGGQAGPSFDCSATEEMLAPAGLVCPPADAALLGRYLDHYVASGVLVGGRRD
ncbi:amino acid adenylation domain-containing protein [Streptosporangium sp. NPDC049376]|uniref:amino acid adenylation domain-containing protein n=1 Tax=Streptosporangium sp. NPDC049376 TaxID=3366192 RepID=UPI00379068E6